MFVGEQPATWVIGQVDYRSERRVFGMPSEGQALAHWQYGNGISATLVSGFGQGTAGFWHRLVGGAGTIEIGLPDEHALRLRRDGAPSETVNTQGETVHGTTDPDDSVYHERAVADAVDALLTGRESEVSARRALNVTEIVFAIYECSRRRGRVDLPLTIDDHPLVSMIESGDLNPATSSA
jgi:predicted dehydrogenase